MPTLYTIGYKKKPLAEFVRALQEAGMDAVIDVRLRNTSHLLGYAKRENLEFLLPEGFGIAYEHHPELAPSDRIFDRYREDQDWDAYVAAFLPLLAERETLATGRELLARYASPCLLCAEPTPDKCHRRLVAEYLAEHLPDIMVRHL